MLPIDGTQATIQSVDAPSGVIPDGAGGFYIVSTTHNRVYRVSASGAISVFAGSSFGFGGDGGSAKAAKLATPKGLAIDAVGSVYIADLGNNRIRKITSQGVITTVAGTGIAGFSGDGGIATSAQLNRPSYVAVDAIGNVYVSDEFNHRIRRINPTGIITTIAGTGSAGFSGDGGLSSSAQISFPGGIAIAFDHVYFVDGGNYRIRKIAPNGVISTVAGTGIPGFAGDGGPALLAQFNPSAVGTGMAIDSAGNVYFADGNNSRIRRISTAGIMSTFAGGSSTPGTNPEQHFGGDGGPATLALLDQPANVAVDSAGGVYIADHFNDRVRRVDSNGTITTICGDGTKGLSADGVPVSAARLAGPVDVAFDRQGNLYIAELSNHRIRKVSASGVTSTFAGGGAIDGDGIMATTAALALPLAVAVDLGGNLYIAERDRHRIRKVDTAGIISTIAGTGASGYGGDGGPATAALLNFPTGVTADLGGNIYIADSRNHRVRKITPGGIINTVAGNGLAGYSGDGGLAVLAQINEPLDIAVDSNGNIFVADYGNNRVRKVNTSGSVSTVAGGGPGSAMQSDGGPATAASIHPVAVTLDSLGNLYVTDLDDRRIRKVNPTGTITTVAGFGEGFGGDGGPATAAQLHSPVGTTFDAIGNLYIADLSNHRIRKLCFNSCEQRRVGTFAQIASGGGWKTTLILLNLSMTTVTGEINFYSDAGRPLVLPFSTSGLATISSAAPFSIPAKGSLVVETGSAAATVTTGWADVKGSSQLAGYAIFRQQVAGMPDSEGTAELQLGNPSTIAFGYDNTAGFQTALALVNLSMGDSTVSVTIRDQDGIELGSVQFAMSGAEHTAFFLSDRFTLTAGRRGVIEFQNSVGITGVGLRFSPSLSFTSIPVVRN